MVNVIFFKGSDMFAGIGRVSVLCFSGAAVLGGSVD